MNKLILIFTLFNLAGFAYGNDIPAQDINEVFVNDEGPYFSTYLRRGENDPNYPRYSTKCRSNTYNLKLNGLSYLGGIIKLDNQNHHMNILNSPAKINGKLYNPCKDKDNDKVFRLLRERFKNHDLLHVKQSLSFRELSYDGTSLMAIAEVAPLKADSDSFPFGTLRAGLEFSLSACRDEYGRIVSTLSGQLNNARDIISYLRRSQNLDISSCTLSYKKGRLVNYLKDVPTEVVFQGAFLVSSTKPNALQLLLNGKIESQFQREGGPQDPGLAQRAKLAAKEFNRILIEDYGDLLYALAEQDDSQTERDEIVLAFFENKSDRLLSLLEEIEQHFSHLSLMGKISMARSIRSTYLQIGRLEAMRKVSGHLSLDRVIRRY